jgi:hypothetical protein
VQVVIIFVSVPGRKPGKFEGRDTLPYIILNGYAYQFKKRMVKEGILSAAKRIKDDPREAVAKSLKLRQVYCVSKRRFHAEATKEEVNSDLALYLAQEDKGDFHRIVQHRLR